MRRHTRPRLPAAAWLVALCAIGCASEERVSVAVELRTDLVPGRELVGTRAAIYADLATETPIAWREAVAVAGGDYARGVRIAELADVPVGARVVHVELLGPGGAVVADRHVLQRVEASTSVVVVITRDCAGVECEPDETCFAGGCVDPRCGPETPEHCPDSACFADRDCAPRHECNAVACAQGVCLQVPRDGRCDEGELCDDELGCVAPERCEAAADCDDGVPCTIDVCGATGTCAHDPDPARCDDANPCTDDACRPTGCEHTTNDADCDDGLYCNGADRCEGAACVVHAGSPCAETCNEVMASCEACVGDVDCGEARVEDWSECTFEGACDEAGQRVRAITTPRCEAGACEFDADLESEPCPRSTDGLDCGASRICAGGACVACGARGQPCCAGAGCDPGAACEGGTCAACGALGDACCPGDTCSGGHRCLAGACAVDHRTRLCVEGVGSSCIGAGGDWTGGECCVDDVTQCVEGIGSSCIGAGGAWTGAVCCVDAALCTTGIGSSCIGAGGAWTGRVCCLEADQCVDGAGSSCVGAGYAWTGTTCCVPPGLQCVDGIGSSCIGAGGEWTGDLCCVSDALTCTTGGSGSSCIAGGGAWTGSLCCR